MHRGLWLLAVALVPVGACRSERPRFVTPPDTIVDMPSPPHPPDCPVRLEGTDVTLTTIEGGSALVFTSARARPISVRRAAWKLAERYESPPFGPLGPASGPDVHYPAGVPTNAEYADVVSGARIEIRAIRPEDIPDVRAHLRKLVTNMTELEACSVPQDEYVDGQTHSLGWAPPFTASRSTGRRVSSKGHTRHGGAKDHATSWRRGR